MKFLQVVQPKLQRRRLAFAKHKHVRSRILKYLKEHAGGRLMDENGDPNKKTVASDILSTCENIQGKVNAIEGSSATEVTEAISEEFKSNKTNSLELAEIVGHIVELMLAYHKKVWRRSTRHNQEGNNVSLDKEGLQGGQRQYPQLEGVVPCYDKSFPDALRLFGAGPPLEFNEAFAFHLLRTSRAVVSALDLGRSLLGALAWLRTFPMNSLILYSALTILCLLY
ncbi:sodium/calcium exchanger family protein / calcium-binding EF hand family protein [Artemisia annua]|uniref:Sodium/calcium exchanger family protein / calcium-binding EF hand family protein n=1 Tax=Artemisia annua TaxID=35608 RepID=A0A2U1L9A4_ARTAN|nr:sodium/calcium exchanger family protein / calcium-binding EF hand family protein [Artemisia annua]